jgi:hypothetical protein
MRRKFLMAIVGVMRTMQPTHSAAISSIDFTLMGLPIKTSLSPFQADDAPCLPFLERGFDFGSRRVYTELFRLVIASRTAGNGIVRRGFQG